VPEHNANFNHFFEVSMSKKIVTVFAATGSQGSATTRALLMKGWEVRAVTRDANSSAATALATAGAKLLQVSVILGDELDQALAGSDAVVMALPALTDIHNSGEAGQGMLIAEAAVRAKVNHFVYSSAIIEHARGVLGMGSKRAIEERLAELGLRTTILRPAFFMENLDKYFPVQLVEGRYKMVVPIPIQRKTELVAIADIAAAVCAALDAPDRFIGKEIDLVGDSLSLEDMAQQWAAAHGLATDPVALDPAALAGGWPQGVPLFKWLNDVGTRGDAEAIGELVTKPTKFHAWLQSRAAH
jgi:uncharacterized protein YbjT (DUF2867 family)